MDMGAMPPSPPIPQGNYLGSPMDDTNSQSQDIQPGMGIGVDDGFQEPNDSAMGDGQETNPKNEIQRITGELSQKLNDYVSQNQEDSETSKYVLSMIAKQASKNMSDKDKSDVIKKIKSSSDEMSDDMDNMPLGESKNDIKETFTSAISVFDKDKKDKMDKPSKRIRNLNNTSPFYSNR